MNLDKAAERAAAGDRPEGYGLIVTTGAEERVVAHAVFELERADRAEVAFAVADEMQGRGLATVLIAHLAQVASARGVTTFTATVLPENRRMISVFRESGFPVEVHASPDGIELEFPTELGEDARRRFEDRDRVAAVAAVRARAAAAVGGRRRRVAAAGLVRRRGVPAHPGQRLPRRAVPGQPERGVRRLAGGRAPKVSAGVDLAIVAVPAAAVPGVARECAAAGVAALVVITAGFAEAGAEGAARLAELLDVCRASGMRLVGPNCMGVVNTDPDVSLTATFARADVPAGTIGFVSQSGAFGAAAIDGASRRGIGLSAFVSLGDKADLSSNDLLQYWEQDPATQVVALYLESFGNPRKFGRVARRVARAKPVLAVKAGRTSAGARAASLAHGRADRGLRLDRRRAVRERGRDPLRRARRPARRRRRAVRAAAADGQRRGDRRQRARPAGRLRRRVRGRRAGGRDARAGDPGRVGRAAAGESVVAGPVQLVASETPEAFAAVAELVAADPGVRRRDRDLRRAHRDAAPTTSRPRSRRSTWRPAAHRVHDAGQPAGGAAPGATGAARRPRARADAAAGADSPATPSPVPPTSPRATAARPGTHERDGSPPTDPSLSGRLGARSRRSARRAGRRALGRAAPTRAGARRRAEPPVLDDVDADAAAAILAGALARGGGWLRPDEVEALLAAYGIALVEQRRVALGRRGGQGRGGARRRRRAQGHRARRRAQGAGGRGAARPVRPDRGPARGAGDRDAARRGRHARRGLPRPADGRPGRRDARRRAGRRALRAGRRLRRRRRHRRGARRRAGPARPARPRGRAGHDLALRSLALLQRADADVDALADIAVRVGALADAHPAIAELDLNPVMVGPDGARGGRRARAGRAARRPARVPGGRAMKRIGLLGGMSWESTIEYYRLVNELVAERLGGLHSADCLLRSVDFAEIEVLQREGRWAEAGERLAREAQHLEAAGAELLVLCTNTMHKVAAEIELAITIPFVHIADTTAAAVRGDGLERVGLLATAYTMEQDFYVGRLRDRARAATCSCPTRPTARSSTT